MNASASPARSLRAVGIGPSLQKLRYLVRHHPGEEIARSAGEATADAEVRLDQSDTLITPAEKKVAPVPR